MRRIVLPLALLLVGVALLAVGGRAEGTEPKSFQECAFVAAMWHPDHAPGGVPDKFKGTTPVPEGWTVVGGNMGSTPAMLVCR